MAYILKIKINLFYVSCKLKTKSINKLTIGYLNINSISNKFHHLKKKAESEVDIFVIIGEKLDSTFPTSQFFYKTF